MAADVDVRGRVRADQARRRVCVDGRRQRKCPYLRALPPFLFHGPVHDGVRSVDEPAVIGVHGLLTVSDEVWGLAVRRAQVIGALARADIVGLVAVGRGGAAEGLSAAGVCAARMRSRSAYRSFATRTFSQMVNCASSARGWPGACPTQVAPRKTSLITL